MWHLGMARNDETLQPEKYYTKLPSDISVRQVILADPMLATAGSTVAAIDILREHGVKDIVFMCLLAAPEGVELFCKAHPYVPIFTSSLDRQLSY